MLDNAFLDTNILLYSLSDNPVKKAIAMDLLAHQPTISTQVLNELSNVALKKLKLDSNTLLKVVRLTQSKTRVVNFDAITIEQAIKIQSRYKLQYYDSLIVATAFESGCTVLYSEDMHHGLTIKDQLQICNPFISQASK